MSAPDGYCRECGLDLDADPGGDHDENHRLCWSCWEERESADTTWSSPQEAAEWFVRAGTVENVDQLQGFLRMSFGTDPSSDEYRVVAEEALRAHNGSRRDRRPGGHGKQPAALLIDMCDAMAHANDALPYRVPPLALDGYVTLCVGRRGENKTWLAMFACSAVASGCDAAPLRAREGPALLFDWESGSRLLARRFTLMGLAHDAFHVADGSELRLPDDIDAVRGVVEHVGARLVVFDSLRRLARNMREDKSDDATPVMAALANLARDTGTAVVVLHNRSTKPNAPDVRGSSALEDQADAVFVLERVAGDPERRTRRRLRCTKMRPDREPSPLWLSFKSVAGFMTLAEAEPYEQQHDDPDAPSAAEEMADRMRELAELVRQDGGWAPKRLATALGTQPNSGTFTRARALLIESREWQEIGSTRDRRLRPADSRHSSQPPGDGENGENQEAPAELFPDPPRDAIYGPEDAD